MLIIECNECGEAIGGATRAELVRRLISHLEEDHSQTVVPAQAKKMIDEQAYYATDA